MGADDFAVEAAAAGDDVGVRVHSGAVGKGNFFTGVAVGGKADSISFQEVVIGLGVFIHADAEDSAAKRCDAMLQLIQGLGFINAGRAPGGPKIQQDYFAVKVREMCGLAVQREGEVFGGASTQARLALAIVGTRKQEEQSRNEGENDARV